MSITVGVIFLKLWLCDVLRLIFAWFCYLNPLTFISGRKQWVREEDLAKELKLHAKQLRKIIRHFEEQNLIMRDHRKEVCAEKTYVLVSYSEPHFFCSNVCLSLLSLLCSFY